MSAVHRALDRVRGRSVWWFVLLAVLISFFPIATPVQIAAYALLAVAFWIPFLLRTGRAFREGYRGR